MECPQTNDAGLMYLPNVPKHLSVTEFDNIQATLQFTSQQLNGNDQNINAFTQRYNVTLQRCIKTSVRKLFSYVRAQTI